jgi:hypothetical protein
VNDLLVNVPLCGCPRNHPLESPRIAAKVHGAVPIHGMAGNGSLPANLRITQVVEDNKGVHACSIGGGEGSDHKHD